MEFESQPVNRSPLDAQIPRGKHGKMWASDALMKETKVTDNRC